MRRFPKALLRRITAPANNSPARRPLNILNLEERSVPAVFTVANTNDIGPGSLRQALNDANLAAGPDVINFDTAGAFATPRTIDIQSAFPVIAGDLTINGTGTANLTVQRAPGAVTNFRVFNSVANTLTLTDFTVRGGNPSGGGGGLQAGGTILIERMAFTGNQATGVNGGGGIRVTADGALTVRDSTVSGNTAGTSGGGIYFFLDGSLVVENSTISGNTAQAAVVDYEYLYGGGGIYFFGTADSFVVRNSTIANNTTPGSGGGIHLHRFRGTATIQNSTITGNTSVTTEEYYGGGGIGSVNFSSGAIELTNTILSGNTNANGPDVYTDLYLMAVTATSSALGSTTGIQTFVDGGGNLPLGTNLMLGGLAPNGGPTQTMAPQAGSPLIDAGSNALVPEDALFDQRGFGYLRTFAGAVDIGAVEVQPPGRPIAVANTTDVGNADEGETAYTFTVRYGDVTGTPAQQALNLSTIIGNNSAVRVSGPNGFTTLATFVSLSPGANLSDRTATYTINVPGGAWDRADNGPYAVNVQPNQVFDADGNAVPAGRIGSFDVAILNFTVSTTDDDGFGSLRQVLEDTNTDPGPNTVAFDPDVFGTVPRTISLLSPLPVLSADGGAITIPGPGADLLTIRRDPTAPNFGVIHSQAPEFDLAGVTITGGVAETSIGGGIRFGSSSVNTLDHVVVTGNSATGNAVKEGSGGGIGMDGFVFLNLQSTTVSGNTAERKGGGVYFYFNGNLLVEDSTISGNATTTADDALGGGGVYFAGFPYYSPPAGFTPGALTVRNSTIADNTTAGSGGGILTGGVSGGLLVENSTISGNVADSQVNGGGGVAAIDSPFYTNYLGLDVVNSIVSGNTNALAPDILNGYDNNYVYSSAVGDLENLLGFTITGGSDNLDVNDFADLMLTALGDFGGPTETFGVLAGSPLIDAGNTLAVNPVVVTDQRGPGFERVFGDSVDIGAVEFQPPGVTVTPGPGQADPTNSTTILFTVTFESPVTGFDAPLTDVVLSGTAGATTAVITPVSGSVYTVAVSGMTVPGTVTVTIPADAAVDLVGAGNLASAGGDDTIDFDNVAPTATFEQDPGQIDPTNVEPVVFTVDFSEPVVGFDGTDVVNTGTLTGTPTVIVLPIGATTYSVTFTNLTGEGTIVPGFVPGGVTDAAGNDAAIVPGNDSSVTFDNLGPRVTLNQGAGQGDPTNSTTIVFDVVFSEPVTDFTVADVDLSGSTAVGVLVPVVSGSGTTYTVTVTGMVDGDTVVATVLGGGTTDALGNVGSASTSTDNSVTFDTSSPTVTVNQAAGQADPAVLEPIRFTADFSEVVAGFTGSDVVLTGAGAAGATATLTQDAGDPTIWTISVSGMTGSGPVIASLPGANYTDAAGNPGTDSTSTDNSVQFNFGGSFVLSRATYTVREDGATLDVIVSRVGGTEGAVSVTISTGGGTATPGVDYTTVTQTVNFAAGVGGNQTVSIPILDDRIIELIADTFNVTLSNPTSATSVVRLGDPNTALVTITDIEEGQFDFSAPVFSAAETGGTMTFTVTRTNGSSGAVSVGYATAIGTAHTGGPGASGQNDFTATVGTLNFADGETSKPIVVPIVDDTFNEGRERFTVTLSNPTGNTLLGPLTTATGLILPDDGTDLTPKGVPNTDADGDTVTIKLSSGTGKFFRDDPDGDQKGGIDLITVAGTTDTKSSLTVTVKKLKDNVTPDAGKMALGGITGTGLKSISAKTAYLTADGVNLTGFLGSLTIGDVLNGADIVTGASANPKAKTNITAGVIGDGTAITVGGAAGTTGTGIGSLTATQIGAGTITAPVIGSITTKGSTKAPVSAGNLASSVTVSGAGVAAGKLSLGKVMVAGSILATADITAPSVGPVSAKGTLAADLVVTGPVSTIKAGAITGSTIAANSLGSLSAVGNKKTSLAADITGLTLTLLGVNVPDNKAVLGTFSAGGTVSNSNVSAGGNVTKLSALNFRGSNFYVGFTGTEAGVGAFETVATLKTVSITGATDGYQDSNIIATTLGALTFKSVDADNGGTKFGVISDTTIKSLKVTVPAFEYTSFNPNTQGLNPDFEVKVV